MAFDKVYKKHALITVLGIATLAFLILVQIVSAASDQTGHDLTGVWKCDDGGTYYLSQTNNVLCWYGEKDPISPAFSNVAQGTIDGSIINLQWADVPKGTTLNSGILTLNIVSNDELQATKKTGNFGGSLWTRSGTTPTQAETPAPTPNPTPVETPTFVVLGDGR